MGLLRLWNTVEDMALVKDYTTPEPYRLPNLSSGDRLNLEYTLLKRAVTGGLRTPWERQLAGSYSLTGIGLFLASDRTQLAYQNSFTDLDSYTKGGVLALDTPEVATALASVTEAACVLEIEVTDGAGNDHTFLRQAVTLVKALLVSGAESVPPDQLAATQEWVKNLFLPKDGTNAATPATEHYMQSTGGTRVRIYVDDDGVLQSEKF